MLFASHALCIITKGLTQFYQSTIHFRHVDHTSKNSRESIICCKQLIIRFVSLWSVVLNDHSGHDCVYERIVKHIPRPTFALILPVSVA